jgi:NAD-dependent deacetylase
MSHTPIAIARHESVVVLTGAGVSAESGLRTFRDADGFWYEHRVEDVATPEGFAADPGRLWRFYGQLRAKATAARPNPGHLALAALEAALGPDRFLLVTQNVDALHEAAGSRAVLHMHGELSSTRCSDPACDAEPFHDPRTDFGASEGAGADGADGADTLPRCACGALQRPNVVFFGEVPLEMPRIKRRVEECHLFVTVGSSGVVYPAAGLVRAMERRRSAGLPVRSVYVGLEAPENACAFDELRLGPAGEVLPGLFEVEA